jgi:hypothetical protein
MIGQSGGVVAHLLQRMGVNRIGGIECVSGIADIRRYCLTGGFITLNAAEDTRRRGFDVDDHGELLSGW